MASSDSPASLAAGITVLMLVLLILAVVIAAVLLYRYR